MNKTKLREAIEKKMGVLLKRGWHLDGAGPSRYGWAALHPCKVVFLAPTLEEIAHKIATKEIR